MENNCINCQNIELDRKTGKYFCIEFSNQYDGKIWVDWPDSQTCGTEDIGEGTGKFVNKKRKIRILKLEELGI